METALVIKTTGSRYEVRTEAGESREVRIKGRLRLQDSRTTNPVAIGDKVEVEGENLVSVCERRNCIIRHATNLSKQAQILAANLDQVLLVICLRHPATPAEFIDRYLVAANSQNLPVLLLFNKIDLYTEQDYALLQAYHTLYTSLEYRCFSLSVKQGIGVDALQRELQGKTSLLSGNSGVGKSSLLNRLLPEVCARTAEVSQVHHTGMHTTTFSQMYAYKGGYIVDTPGVKGFGLIDFRGQELATFFPEIARFAQRCRFSDCTHRQEPGCAVREAVEEHYISTSRYNSYLSMLEDEFQKKYR